MARVYFIARSLAATIAEEVGEEAELPVRRPALRCPVAAPDRHHAAARFAVGDIGPCTTPGAPIGRCHA
jgi:hypothetical protein